MKQEHHKKQVPTVSKLALTWYSLIIGTAVAAVLVYIFLAYDPPAWLGHHLDKNTNPYIFAILMALLPVCGMPISIFLILVGMIFGLPGAILLTATLMLFHFAVTYYLTHSLFRPMLVRLLGRFDIEVPRLPQTGRIRFALIFMLIPGLPYAIKNYILALSDLPFSQYIWISWLAQFSLSLPFIMLGKAVIKMDPLILVLALMVVLVCFAGQYYLRHRYRNLD